MSEDQTLFIVIEMVHALARESDALDKAINDILLSDSSGRLDLGNSAARRKRRSFYRDFEWRVDAGLITSNKALSALKLIIRQTDHFRVHVHNLLGSLSQTQTLTLSYESIDLESLLQEAVDLFEFSATEKGIEIRSNIAGHPVITGDRELLHRMLVNLLDNAIKYSFSRSEASGERFISIDCRRHSMHNDWAISVKSYGVGIDPEEIASGYIFQYGARGRHSSDRGRGGTGIGLAEAKRIAEAHRGEIKVESTQLDGGNYVTIVKAVIKDAGTKAYAQN